MRCPGDLEIKNIGKIAANIFFTLVLILSTKGLRYSGCWKKFSSDFVHQVIGRPGGQTAGKYGGKRATQTFLVNHGQPVR
jgi:hypothetical protein